MRITVLNKPTWKFIKIYTFLNVTQCIDVIAIDPKLNIHVGKL